MWIVLQAYNNNIVLRLDAQVLRPNFLIRHALRSGPPKKRVEKKNKKNVSDFQLCVCVLRLSELITAFSYRVQALQGT